MRSGVPPCEVRRAILLMAQYSAGFAGSNRQANARRPRARTRSPSVIDVTRRFSYTVAGACTPNCS